MGMFSKLKKEEDKKLQIKNSDSVVFEKETSPLISDETLKTTGQAYEVLVKPVVSEKAAVLADMGQYTFEVSWTANRSQVKEAIWRVYGIKPLKVNIVTMKGKLVRTRRARGVRQDWKKAIVIMPKDKKLSIYEGV